MSVPDLEELAVSLLVNRRRVLPLIRVNCQSFFMLLGAEALPRLVSLHLHVCELLEEIVLPLFNLQLKQGVS